MQITFVTDLENNLIQERNQVENPWKKTQLNLQGYTVYSCLENQIVKT